MSDDLELSAEQARRIALGAQGFGRTPAGGPANLHRLGRLLYRLGAVQIDAVNVLVRSHYLPAYSRLGGYPPDLFDRLIYRRRAGFEYLGHAASVLPVELHPSLRWRMAQYAQGRHWTATRARIDRERPGYLAAVEREIADRGPLAFAELTDPARQPRTPTRYTESTMLWWHWSDGKAALEGLFAAGRLAVANRSDGFERRYDLTERVIPAPVLAAPTPPADDAQRALVRHAGAALGVATVRDLADYFRLPMATTRARVRELVDDGELRPVRVEGWTEPAVLARDADDTPVCARALLSPFDSLIWERARTRRLFDFQHSFELYVPATKRRYGYYVLPFLLGDRLVARVDLKADRARRALLVSAAFAEPAASPSPSQPSPSMSLSSSPGRRGRRSTPQPGRELAVELAEELRELARWLNLDLVDVGDRGDLAPRLARLLR